MQNPKAPKQQDGANAGIKRQTSEDDPELSQAKKRRKEPQKSRKEMEKGTPQNKHSVSDQQIIDLTDSPPIRPTTIAEAQEAHISPSSNTQRIGSSVVNDTASSLQATVTLITSPQPSNNVSSLPQNPPTPSTFMTWPDSDENVVLRN